MRRYWGERISAVVFILIAAYVADMALAFPAGGGTFPLFAAGGTVLLSLLMIADTYLRRDPRRAQTIRFDLSYGKLKPAIITVVTIVYILAIFEIGYFVASALFLVVACLLIGIRSSRAIVITAVVLFPLMYVFFEIFLMANLPRGLLI